MCRKGACDVVLESKFTGYKARLAQVGDQYVGQVRRNNEYTCGAVNNDANENIRLTPLASRFIGGEWIITKLKGLLIYSQISSNGGCRTGVLGLQGPRQSLKLSCGRLGVGVGPAGPELAGDQDALGVR